MRETFVPFVFAIVGATCSRAHAEVDETPVFPRAHVPSPAKQGLQVGVDRKGRKAFKSNLAGEPFRPILYAVPALTSEHVVLYLDVPPAYENKTCSFGMLFDGNLLSPDSQSVTRIRRGLVKVVLPAQVLKRMSAAKHVSVRYCEGDHRLDETQRERVAEFSIRVAEEVAWLSRNNVVLPAEPATSSSSD